MDSESCFGDPFALAKAMTSDVMASLCEVMDNEKELTRYLDSLDVVIQNDYKATVYLVAGGCVVCVRCVFETIGCRSVRETPASGAGLHFKHEIHQHVACIVSEWRIHRTRHSHNIGYCVFVIRNKTSRLDEELFFPLDLVSLPSVHHTTLLEFNFVGFISTFSGFYLGCMRHWRFTRASPQWPSV